MLISELNRGGRISRNENRISIYQTQGEINTSSVFQRETKTSEREVLTEHAHKKADIAKQTSGPWRPHQIIQWTQKLSGNKIEHSKMRKYKGVSKSYLDRTDKLLHCSLFSFFLRLFIGSFSSSLRKNLTLPQAHPVSPYNNQRKLLFSLLLPKKYLFSLNPLASLQNTPLCPPKLSLLPSISSQLFVRLNFFQENEKKKTLCPLPACSTSYLYPYHNPQKCLSCHAASFSVQFCLPSSNGYVPPFSNNSPIIPLWLRVLSSRLIQPIPRLMKNEKIKQKKCPIFEGVYKYTYNRKTKNGVFTIFNVSIIRGVSYFTLKIE